MDGEYPPKTSKSLQLMREAVSMRQDYQAIQAALNDLEGGGNYLLDRQAQCDRPLAKSLEKILLDDNSKGQFTVVGWCWLLPQGLLSPDCL